MTDSPPPLSHGEYARRVRARLPESAFARTPHRLLDGLPHVLVFFAGVLALRSMPGWVGPIVALVVGHSLGCLAFLAHDVAHGSVLPRSVLRRALEFGLWSLNLVPPTLWRRIHNDGHHSATGTPDDPDRPFLAIERSLSRSVYECVFSTGRDAWLRWNPLALVHFVPYLIRNLAAAFLPSQFRPAVVPSSPRFTPGQRARVALEILGIVSVQVGIFHLAGGTWSTYLWLFPGAVLVSSALIMTYVFTNHFLDPIRPEVEPLLGTTSLRVPRYIDLLHANFSHHVEHHLFPGTSPRHFPAVRRVLAREFPERYRCMRLVDAWRAVVQRRSFVD